MPAPGIAAMSLATAGVAEAQTANIGPIETLWVHDKRVSPIGIKDVATGKRVRDLPITLSKLL
jgi:hypothetical protein